MHMEIQDFDAPLCVVMSDTVGAAGTRATTERHIRRHGKKHIKAKDIFYVQLSQICESVRRLAHYVVSFRRAAIDHRRSASGLSVFRKSSKRTFAQS